ncbi:MAG: Gfo/Idh/MocA family oxidoreductase [Verrucomicrobia bacterium]|nr:Gfo/Idh/MocA family oxidoreductase [Verrucomicrobiota bacterium]MBU1735402.1 Gfo/Idh/MocA family oxidoreductase [Verrucomicrobiota bacterium]MBU1857443.1 Gfo/Idh/MocA family oxidoreductase [Verrucomicrobiota bacterium]
MAIKVGICGVGAFAQNFIPLFKAHPLVENIVLCDLDPKKLEENSKKHALPDTCPSLDELCRKDVDAVAIFTQNWLHGPQAVQALRSGKHVYSAVPSAITMEEITDMVKTVGETGKIYMVGETSYYYPCALYCRERFRKGDFGHIVYAEGEYYHDFDHGLYEVCKWRGGARWKEIAGSPPMFYPTHSISMIVSVTGAHTTHVSCLGFVDRHEDGLFRKGVNIWDNEFSNETALMRMSDGSMCRINEFRRIGHPGEVRMSLYGTLGSYEEQWQGQVWATKDRKCWEKLNDTLACTGRTVKVEGDVMDEKVGGDASFSGVSQVHPVSRLPKEFAGLPNGHCGSHQFLVDDFVKACVSGEQPPNNVWQAARYLVPGLIAHESAKQGGVLLEVPDFGDAPG